MLHTAAPEEDGALWAEALERGRIVQFPASPVELPPENDQRFLREELGARLARKNVSFYPEAKRLSGLKADPAVRARAQRILETHSQRVRAFLSARMPHFTRGMVEGTCSFRPLEEAGRNLSAHASNELLHVDAGAYGATHGDRILRFFVNLNPARERVWISRGPFAPLLEEYGAAAGLERRSLRPGAGERLASAALRAVRPMVPMARVLESSPYDRQMRRFHNWMKDTPAFQQGPQQRFSFAPLTAWMVLTDGVSHACISGQHALVDTFLVPLANCRLPAPYHLLEGARA